MPARCMTHCGGCSTNRPKLEAASISSIVAMIASTKRILQRRAEQAAGQRHRDSDSGKHQGDAQDVEAASTMTLRGAPPSLPKYAIVTPISG